MAISKLFSIFTILTLLVWAGCSDVTGQPTEPLCGGILLAD
jgi:hypothetical protein